MPLQVFCRNCAQYRNEWCKLKVDSPDPDMVRDCQYYRGKTNADRIRAMTDEDLAEYIRAFFPEICPPWKCPGEDYCYKCWLDWLKSPVEVDNG